MNLDMVINEFCRIDALISLRLEARVYCKPKLVVILVSAKELIDYLVSVSLWKAQTTVGTCAKFYLALFVDVVGVVCCLDSAIQLLLKSKYLKDRRNHFEDVLRAKII